VSSACPGRSAPASLDVPACSSLLRSFLAEDFGAGDITTDSIVPANTNARGVLVAKAPLVLAGRDVFSEVFRILDVSAHIHFSFADGEEIAPGSSVAAVEASARALLGGERVALNLLQRLSGVATLTRAFVRAVEGTSARILDTRKTTPGLRALEKYAVRTGGGLNHRVDLGEAILIKENHIRMAGGIRPALSAAESGRGLAAWIEIEVTNLTELREALDAAPDIILLDNMSSAQAARAVEEVRGRHSRRAVCIEASGGITLENVREFAEAGVDWISVGALTHSAPAVDLSFEIDLA
jgi:nicotinate-nucleotide pyrophosphorylase (carboxylating)